MSSALVGAVAVGMIGVFLLGCAESPEGPPAIEKVILISIDTLRADFLECYDPQRSLTPNIDRFAAENVLFSDVLSQAPSTAISHKSILYSLYPAIHKTTMTTVPDEMRTSPLEQLQANGFLTAGFAGGGQLNPTLGFGRGFHTYSHMNFESDYGARVNEVEILQEKAFAWLDEHHDERFLLFLHTYQPHAPYLMPEPYLSRHTSWYRGELELGLETDDYNDRIMSDEDRRFVRDLYAAEVEYTDAFLGRLFAKIRELGIYDRTMIIFMSDHGESLGESNYFGHARFHNIQLRIPLIIRIPGMKPSRLDEPVEAVDVMPTIFSVLKVEPPYPFQGRNLAGIISGAGSLDPLAYRISEQADRACVQGPVWKAVFTGAGPKKFSVEDFEGRRHIRAGNWKLILPLEEGLGPPELYEIWGNPIASHNLAPEHPELVEKLHLKAMAGNLCRPVELYDLSRDPEERVNLADEYPEVLVRLKAYYEATLRAGEEIGDTFLLSPASAPVFDEATVRDLKALGYLH